MTSIKLFIDRGNLFKWQSKLIKSDLIIKRNFLFANFSSVYNLSCALSREQLPDLLDILISQIIPVTATNGEILQDIKGRDQNINLLSLSPPPRADEIMYVAGECMIDNSGRKLYESFNCHVNTMFHEFIGNHHITHKSRVTCQGLSENFPISAVARALPLEIKFFRIGLEIFSSKYFSSMLGFTPTVTEALYIDCSQQEFRLRIESDSLKSRTQIPLEQLEIFNRLDSCLAATFSFRPLQDYLQKASKA